MPRAAASSPRGSCSISTSGAQAAIDKRRARGSQSLPSTSGNDCAAPGAAPGPEARARVACSPVLYRGRAMQADGVTTPLPAAVATGRLVMQKVPGEVGEVFGRLFQVIWNVAEFLWNWSFGQIVAMFQL